MPKEKPKPTDSKRTDPDRAKGDEEDYKPGYGSDDEVVDYEKRIHGDTRRI